MPVFERAIILACLYADPSFRPEIQKGEPLRHLPLQSFDATTKRSRADRLEAKLDTVSRAYCMQAAQRALATL